MQGTMQYLLQSRSGIGTGTVVAVAEPLVTNLGIVISYRRPMFNSWWISMFSFFTMPQAVHSSCSLVCTAAS